MLKPRYKNLAESIGDFARMLDGMNGVQPLERKVDEDLLSMFRAEQELTRLEQQIEHTHRAIYGSGMPISEAESEAIKRLHAHAAAMYNETAERAAARIKELEAEGDKVRSASLEKMKKFLQQAQAKADAHAAAASGPKKKKMVVAHADRRSGSLMGELRKLAGVDVDVQMPRDPGVFGTTRFNEGYEAMAQPFEEGGGSRRSKDMRQGKGLPATLLGRNTGSKTGYHSIHSELKNKDYHAEARTKAQHDAGQEAMMKRNFPKRYAQWVKDKESIVASGRKVSDDERATPRWLNQRIGKVKDDPENDEAFDEGSEKDWSDEKIAAHKKKMKNVARKIHQAGDEIDREYGVKEAKQWAADAVKRPGRLHKYFGVPADQKIPMSKIKAAYNKLKDKENKSAEETSLMRALALGIRFKGGDVPGGEKKKGLAGD